MPFKTVLAVIGGDGTAQDLRHAIDLCAEVGAHLSVVALKIAMAPTMSDYPVDTDWLERRRADHAQFRSVADNDKRLCAESGLGFDFSMFYDDATFLTEEITRRSFYADLIVLGSQIIKNKELVRAIVAGGLFDATRPLLLLPESGKASLRPKRIVLAWNSKIEAVRAMRETLEMLIAADSVHVTMVDPESPYGPENGEPGTDLAGYLARHGVKVVIDQLPSAGRPAEDVLRQHAFDVSADMLIMGAYSHSRLRQRIFGGVTTSMLKGVQLPTLLAR